MKAPTIIVLAAVFGATAVMAGAFGAHGLRAHITPERLQAFMTAAEYQMWHALLLLFLGLMLSYSPNNNDWFRFASYACMLGIVLFSGSLYTLVLTDTARWGMITPIGGLSFIFAWVFVLLGALKIEA